MSVDTSIRLCGGRAPQIDAETASKYIRLNGECVAVECWPMPEQSVGGIYLPDAVRDAYRNRPDIGTVLKAHPSIGLLPGDVVLFNHAHGKRISGFEAGEYKAQNEVRIFGRAVHEEDGDPAVVSWRRSIMARLTNLEAGVETADIVPVGDWCLVRRDSLYESVGVEGTDMRIELPESQKFRSTKGTVERIGEYVDFVSDGDRVIYMATAVKVLEPVRDIVAEHLKDRNLCLMIEAAILAVVSE